MVTMQLRTRGYQIIQNQQLIEATASFIYKGYQISFSTIGCANDQCVTEVNIYSGVNFEKLFKANLPNVQEAINFIDTVYYVQTLPNEVQEAMRAVLSHQD